MVEWFRNLELGAYLTPDRIENGLQALAIVVVGLLVARLVAAAVGRSVQARVGRAESMMVRRAVYWLIAGLVLFAAVQQLGFQVGVLLGAAGVFTVAIGFASQTSASNLISGLFLMVERPFTVGDFIRIDDKTGEVLSIDLLSVKLRSYDNLFLRVPNEEIIKKQITNLTYFPIRRVDLKIGVAYKEDLEKVRQILARIAEAHPLCMAEPEPLFVFLGYGDSSINFQFSVWGARENYLELLNGMYLEIKRVFDEEGVEIPFPHRTLYTGAVTEPMPVRLVDAARRDDALS
jgi:small-conductance mechanosensitive channel